MANNDARVTEITAALDDVRARIRAAAEKAGRDPDSVTLVAVAKTFPATDVAILAELGVTDFGESRDQEARETRDDLDRLDTAPSEVIDALRNDAEAPPPRPSDTHALVDDLRWHFLGQLQRNKAVSVGRWASVVHSVDRVAVLGGLSRGADEAGRLIDVFVQVNLDDLGEGGRAENGDVGAGSRGGVDVSGVRALADAVAATPALRLVGVMAVPPQDVDPAVAFARLADISTELRTTHPGASAISAGMSADFETAIAAGATHVRVGTALLGSRPLHLH